jgi:hypothetical protein
LVALALDTPVEVVRLDFTVLALDDQLGVVTAGA